MNIFYLHNNPETCAKYHNNKHCVKMILETAQILSTAHWMNGSRAPYKQTHINHPCCKWAQKSRQNYLWLANLGLELCKEYSYRYGKVHKTQQHLQWLAKNVPNIANNGFVQPPQCMDIEYKVPGNSVQAYRNYYIHGKRHLANWKKRHKPRWYVEYS